MAFGVAQHLAHHLNQTIIGYDFCLTQRVFFGECQKQRFFITEVVKNCAARFPRGFLEQANSSAFIAMVCKAFTRAHQDVMATAV